MSICTDLLGIGSKKLLALHGDGVPGISSSEVPTTLAPTDQTEI